MEALQITCEKVHVYIYIYIYTTFINITFSQVTLKDFAEIFQNPY